MTEDEAKEKWCPFSRYESMTGLGVNRWKQMAPPEEPHALSPIPCRCIGSACMAWRWLEDVEEVPTDEKCERCKGAGVCVVGSGEDAGGDDCPACGGAGYIFSAVGTGYCGLAGKP